MAAMAGTPWAAQAANSASLLSTTCTKPTGLSLIHIFDALIKFKQEDFANCGDGTMTDDVIRLREEIARQISALKGMKKMAEAYGCDISQDRKSTRLNSSHITRSRMPSSA